MSRLKEISLGPLTFVKSVHQLTVREKLFLLAEMVKVRGLMPLLMKPRNNERWTPEDKAELAIQLRRLSDLSPISS